VQSISSGDPAAADSLLPVLYDELYRLARKMMRKERQNHTLQATALVHEAFLRLVDEDQRSWENRRHFLRVAGRAMRNILVDSARARGAQMRGGGLQRVTLNDDLDTANGATEIVEIDQALSRLAKSDATLAEAVELKFFAGLEFREISELLDMPLRTLERRWQFAKSWLAREITRLREEA